MEMFLKIFVGQVSASVGVSLVGAGNPGAGDREIKPDRLIAPFNGLVAIHHILLARNKQCQKTTT